MNEMDVQKGQFEPAFKPCQTSQMSMEVPSSSLRKERFRSLVLYQLQIKQGGRKRSAYRKRKRIMGSRNWRVCKKKGGDVKNIKGILKPSREAEDRNELDAENEVAGCRYEVKRSKGCLE